MEKVGIDGLLDYWILGPPNNPKIHYSINPFLQRSF